MTSTRAAVDALILQVTPETVLGARAVLLEEATELQKLLETEEDNLDPGLPGSDPISPIARQGFKECNERLLAQCGAQVRELFAAGDRLAAVARSYGRTDEEIAASFKRGQVHPPPPSGPLPGLLGDTIRPGPPVARSGDEMFGGLR